MTKVIEKKSYIGWIDTCWLFPEIFLYSFPYFYTLTLVTTKVLLKSTFNKQINVYLETNFLY